MNKEISIRHMDIARYKSTVSLKTLLDHVNEVIKQVSGIV